mgnify:FL=1
MASIQLRPCKSAYEKDADFIEIPINENNHLRIRREYGHTEDGKRYETVYVAHWRQEDSSWVELSEISYVCF